MKKMTAESKRTEDEIGVLKKIGYSIQ